LDSRFVARAWTVRKSTLEGCVKGKSCRSVLGKKTAFTEAEETDLDKFLFDMARRGFPLTESDIRDLALQYASRYDVIKPLSYGPSHTYAVIVGHVLDSVGQLCFAAGIKCPIIT